MNKQSNKFYTGIGYRETPLFVLYQMSLLSAILERRGYILRSGCAAGADAAFEDSLELNNQLPEIYIPNKGFPKRVGGQLKSHYICPADRYGLGSSSLYREAMMLIDNKKIHKSWRNCKDYVRDLHNRNVFQVLGQDLKTPSSFVACYTLDGAKKYDDTNRRTGGSATAINTASLYSIPVFNLSVKEDYVRIKQFIDTNMQLINIDRINDIKPRSDLNRDHKQYRQLLDGMRNEENLFLEQSNTPRRRPSL